MHNLKKHTIEILAIVWLSIVAIQYLGRYFVSWLHSLDFTFAYIIMLLIVVSTLTLRALRGLQKSFLAADERRCF